MHPRIVRQTLKYLEFVFVLTSSSTVLRCHCSALVAHDPQSTRWVIVSRSNTAAAKKGKPPLAQLRVDRMATSIEDGTDNGQHQQQGCAAIFDGDSASSLTPRQDLLPVSLLSPATSSVRAPLSGYPANVELSKTVLKSCFLKSSRLRKNEARFPRVSMTKRRTCPRQLLCVQ